MSEKNKDCPCTPTCKRCGNCAECQAYHHSKGGKTYVENNQNELTTFFGVVSSDNFL